MGSWTIVALRLIHIVVGVAWVGAVVFLAGFLLPSIRAVGPAGGPIMEQLGQVRRLPIYMMSGAILTILSGIALYWRDSAGFSSGWLASGTGRVFGAGAVLSIAAAVLGGAINSPTARRLGELGAAMQRAGGPPAPEQLAEVNRLQARLHGATQLVAVLLLVATAAMAVARYVP